MDNEVTTRRFLIWGALCCGLAAMVTPAAQAAGVVIGINSMEQEKLQNATPEQQQDTTLKDLNAAGVRPYVQDGRLAGLFYYAWVDTRENFGVFRCGTLTESGRVALAPN
jgi:hypothetical protein